MGKSLKSDWLRFICRANFLHRHYSSILVVLESYNAGTAPVAKEIGRYLPTTLALSLSRSRSLSLVIGYCT